MNHRSPYDRVERDARVRSARAQAHLARVRSRRSGNAKAPRSAASVSRRGLAAALVVGLMCGALWGNRLLAAMAGGSSGVDIIAVRGALHLSADEVAAATGLAPSAPLTDVDTRAVVEQLEDNDWIQLEDNDWIASADAVRMPGGAVVVGIVERTALAAIEIGTPAERYAVDATGSPFAVADREVLEGLPRLTPAESVTPREPSERLAEAVHLAYRLPKIGLTLPAEVSIAAAGDISRAALRARPRRSGRTTRPPRSPARPAPRCRGGGDECGPSLRRPGGPAERANLERGGSGAGRKLRVIEAGARRMIRRSRRAAG